MSLWDCSLISVCDCQTHYSAWRERRVPLLLPYPPLRKPKCETFFEVSRNSLLHKILKGFKSQRGLKLGKERGEFSATWTVNKRKHRQKEEGKLCSVNLSSLAWMYPKCRVVHQSKRELGAIDLKSKLIIDHSHGLGGFGKIVLSQVFEIQIHVIFVFSLWFKPTSLLPVLFNRLLWSPLAS